MRPKLSVVTLGVRDLKRSIRFYKTGLGWPTKATDKDPIAFFPLEGIVLALFPRKLLADDATVDPVGKGFSGITLAINAQSEKEVVAICKRAKQAGGRNIKKAQKASWGGYSGYFADPDNHLWEVAYNPQWKFDKRGTLVL